MSASGDLDSDRPSPDEPISASRWARLTELVDGALQLPLPERAAFVRQSCGGDDAMRLEVESLLLAAGEHGSGSGFLDVAAVDLRAPLARPGARIAHYRVERLVGAGGMGEVYLAHDERLSRPVALKLFPRSALGGAPGRTRLLNEARAASSVSHPNVCVVHDVSDDRESVLYLAMEYISGTSLRYMLVDARAQSTTIPVAEAIALARQAAAGVAAAHEQGVLHRDLKPENLLVRSDGMLKVVDFGLAALLGDAVSGAVSPGSSVKGAGVVTGSHSGVAGTLPYMSPEHLRREALDVRTDIWSLGVVFYEMLTGFQPFARQAEAAAPLAVGEHLPVPPHERNAAVPQWLSALVMRMMADDRTRRPASMREVERALANGGTLQRSEPGRALRLVGVAAGLGALLALGYSTYRQRAGAVAAGERAPRLLVLPFQNLTGVDSLEALGGVAADHIARGLQSVQGVDVVDPSTALLSSWASVDPLFRAELGAEKRTETRSSGSRESITAIRRSLDVARAVDATHVASGRFIAVGDSLVFFVRIVDVQTERQQQLLRISGTIPERSTLLASLNQRVSGALAAAVDRRITELLDPGTAPPSLDAYRAYVEGLHAFAQVKYDAAIPHFKSAIDADSTFILPRFWLMFAYGNSGDRGRRDSVLALVEPLRPSLSPLDAASLDYFIAERDANQLAALEAVRRAAKMAPASNWTYMLAKLTARTGLVREALEILNQLDPTRGWVRGWHGYWSERAFLQHMLGEHEQQLVDARRARMLDPSNLQLRRAHVTALAVLGRLAEIPPLLDSLRPVLDNERMMSTYLGVGLELKAHGFAEDARAYFDSLVAWPDSGLSVKTLDRLERNRARALYERGDFAKAESSLATLIQRTPEQYDERATYAISLAAQGKREPALQAMADLEAIATAPRLQNAHRFVRGIVLGLLGDSVAGTQLIEQSFKGGYNNRLLLHQNLTLRERMRGYEPFERLLRPVQ